MIIIFLIPIQLQLSSTKSQSMIFELNLHFSELNNFYSWTFSFTRIMCKDILSNSKKISSDILKIRLICSFDLLTDYQ